jgi:transcriptional antiterminator NusG
VVGQHVRVVDGPFKGLEGLVEMVQEDRSRLKVSAMVFGRATPIEVGVVDVEKS